MSLWDWLERSLPDLADGRPEHHRSDYAASVVLFVVFIVLVFYGWQG